MTRSNIFIFTINFLSNTSLTFTMQCSLSLFILTHISTVIDPLVINLASIVLFFFVAVDFIPYLESGLPLFPVEYFLFCNVKFTDQEKEKPLPPLILFTLSMVNGAFGKLDSKKCRWSSAIF